MSENVFFSSGFAGCMSTVIMLGIIILLLAGANQHGKEEYKRGYQTGFNTGYVQALKDNHAGIAKYKLVEKPDGTKNWEKVNGKN